MRRERAAREQLGQAGRAARLPEQHGGGQQREAAGARHEQCLRRGTPRLRPLVLEPDQQYDVKPVSSQNTKSAITLSLSTRPSIEPMKAKSEI